MMHQFIEKGEGQVRIIAALGIEVIRILGLSRLQALQVAIGLILGHHLDGRHETLFVVLLDLLLAKKSGHCLPRLHRLGMTGY